MGTEEVDGRRYSHGGVEGAEAMSPVPIKQFTPLDLANHAHMIAEVIVRPNLDRHDEVLIEADAGGYPMATVVVHLQGRPPLLIEVKQKR